MAQKQKKNPPKGRGPRRAANKPPQLATNVRLRHTYRFTSSSGTSTGISPTSLLCAAGCFTTTTNSVVTSLFGSVKVDRISIWTPPASQGSTATCSIEWFGFGNSPNSEVSDTTVSTATPASVSSSPPPQSLASFWQVPSATTFVTLTAPPGSIIDVSVSIILYDLDGTPASSTVATAALGSMYYLSLDPNATHRYVPVSLTTTT